MEHVAERAPLDALPLLSRALSYEESLRRRTEGITWALWGVVLALIFLMYGGMGEVSEGGEAGWLTVLWVPWVLVGSAITWALWRTAALTMVGTDRRPAGLVVTLAWIGAIVAGLAVTMVAPGLPNPENSALLSVGVAWLVMGGANLFRATPEGRRTIIAIGALTLACGLAMAFFLPRPDWGSGSESLVRFLQDLLRAAVAAAAPVALGLRQALRG